MQPFRKVGRGDFAAKIGIALARASIPHPTRGREKKSLRFELGGSMKKALTALAASAALGLALVTVPVATAMAQDDHRSDTTRVQQTQHPDYSKNKYYALSNPK